MTLWPFQNVVCFSAPYTRSFVAPRCSVAYCLYLLSVLALVAFPLFATFASDNVWVKESFYREQPRVSFTHELLVVMAGTSAADAVGWGTSRELEPLLPPEVKVPLVRSSHLDVNRDGVPDTWKLSLEMPRPAAKNDTDAGFRSVLLLAAYDVELREKVREKIGGLVVVDVSSPYPATGVSVRGELKFRQNLPLRLDSAVREVYAEGPLAVSWTSSWAAGHYPVSLWALLERYAARNESVHLEQVLPATWDYSPRERFQLQVEINVPPQLVYYVPGSLEVLKFGWVQVFSFLVPAWMVLREVKAFAFDNQFVETYVVPQLPPRVATT